MYRKDPYELFPLAWAPVLDIFREVLGVKKSNKNWLFCLSNWTVKPIRWPRGRLEQLFPGTLHFGSKIEC